MYSKITITFLKFFDLQYKVAITSGTRNNYSTRTWTWKHTRQNPYEDQVEGSTTGTAARFKDAASIDYGNTYDVTASSNSVIIEALDRHPLFLGYQFRDEKDNLLEKGVDFEVFVENYFPVPNIDTVPMALTKSPHYINIPFTSPSTISATIKVYVWSGLLSQEPANESYKMTIPRPSIDFEEFNVNIADLIDEVLEPKVVLDLAVALKIVNTSDNAVKWVKYEVTYQDPQFFIENIQGYLIAADGYGYYNEGVNPTFPDDLILTSSKVRKVYRNGFLSLPFINNGNITEIVVRGFPSSLVELPISINSPLSGNNSKKIVQYVQLKAITFPSSKFIEIELIPTNRKVLYEVIDECRYNPIQVIFKNKYGQFDHITLFKKSSKSINVKNDDFVNNYIKGGAYDITKHQQKKINITATESIKANSGYINEQENELYKELLLSDSVYLFEKERLVPVNVKTRSLDYKTRVNDQLVNYELSFDYAYNIIQNV